MFCLGFQIDSTVHFSILNYEDVDSGITPQVCVRARARHSLLLLCFLSEGDAWSRERASGRSGRDQHRVQGRSDARAHGGAEDARGRRRGCALGPNDATERVPAAPAPGHVREARAGFLGALRGLCDVSRAWSGQEKVRRLSRRSSTFIMMSFFCVLCNIKVFLLCLFVLRSSIQAAN